MKKVKVLLRHSKVLDLFQALKSLDPGTQQSPDQKDAGFIFSDPLTAYKIARNISILEPIVQAIERLRVGLVKRLLPAGAQELVPDSNEHRQFMEEWAGIDGLLNKNSGENVELFTLTFAELSIRTVDNATGNKIATPVLVALMPIIPEES